MLPKNKKFVKILLTGGGTGGSVSPLLAVVEELNNPPNPLYQGGANPPNPLYQGGGYEFFWIGTKKGPEKGMVEKAGIKFRSITSGKLRRYFSFRNFTAPFFIFIGFIQSFFIILKWRPNLVMTAGSFVSVPVVWAGWLLGVPVLIHQQDKRQGLANKLMASFAETVTVTFKESLVDYGEKAIWTGNPARHSREITNYKLQITNIFNLKNDLPIVLVVGGGTGARAINELVRKSLPELTKFCQVVHVVGKEKMSNVECQMLNYKSFEFLEHDEMMAVMKEADLVVSRAGLGFLTEISYLTKPTIIIPMPDTHQEDNAKIFKDKQAAIVLDQNKLTAHEFTNKIKELLGDELLRSKLRNNIAKVMKEGANEAIARIVERITHSA